MTDAEITSRVKAARVSFARTLLPQGGEVAELLEAGVALQRVNSLYPEAFEGVTPMRLLPSLIDHLELPRVQTLLEIHQGQIGNLWEDAVRAANAGEPDTQLRLRVMLREDWCERLFASPEVLKVQDEVSRHWANAQVLRFSQSLLPAAAKGQRSRHVRHLLVAIAYFWSLSEGALHAEQNYAEQILNLFEPLLNALEDARTQLQGTGIIDR